MSYALSLPHEEERVREHIVIGAWEDVLSLLWRASVSLYGGWRAFLDRLLE